MPLYEITDNKLEPAPMTTFADEGMLEEHLQRLLRADISPLGDDLLVLAEEFGDWEDSKRRIDLLCLDKRGALVVVELKRHDAAHMELQALRYAAMVSSMTLEQAITARARMTGGPDAEDLARATISEFLGAEDASEIVFDQDVRIILVSVDFSPEITTSVLWLNKYDIKIACVRMKPYRIDGKVFVDLTQVIPLPEAADYEVKLRAKADEVKKVQSARGDIFRRFWTAFIPKAQERTSLLARKKPTEDPMLQLGIGKTGFALFVSLSQERARVECYIAFGADDVKSFYAFGQLQQRRQEIESAFGGELDWQALPGRKGCRICKDFPGGWKSDEAEWPALQDAMIAALIRLESSLRPAIQTLALDV